jgi:hypothetical protein
VILVYPATATLHANSHDMLFSPDGQTWQTLDSSDSTAQQQSEANVPGFGTVSVAGVIGATQPSTASESGRTTLAIVLLVLAGCAMLIGIGLLLRSRRA